MKICEKRIKILISQLINIQIVQVRIKSTADKEKAAGFAIRQLSDDSYCSQFDIAPTGQAS